MNQSDSRRTELRDRYLRAVAERVGWLELPEFAPDGQRVPLEKVYTDIPIKLVAEYEIADSKISDWWIGEKKEPGTPRDPAHSHEADKILDRAAIQLRMDAQQAVVDTDRQNWSDPETEYVPYEPWLDDRGYYNRLFPADLIGACQKVVLLGAPGSGKSTIVRRLVLLLAGAGIADWTRTSLADIPHWPLGAITPIYIDLYDFMTNFPLHHLSYIPTAYGVREYIRNGMLEPEFQDFYDELIDDMENGRALLVLDGLDEIPYPEGRLSERQSQMKGLLDSLQTEYGALRIVVTSRTVGYDGWKVSGFHAFELNTLYFTDGWDLATRLLANTGIELQAAFDEIKMLVNELADLDPGLSNRALLMTVVTEIYTANTPRRLPEGYGELHWQFIQRLLDRWMIPSEVRHPIRNYMGTVPAPALLSSLAALAWNAQAASDGQQPMAPFRPAQVFQYLRPVSKSGEPSFVTFFNGNPGVLMSVGQGSEGELIHFAHSSFQEYLAGRHLVEVCLAGQSFVPIRDLFLQDPQKWDEPCRLAGHALCEISDSGKIWNLMGDLVCRQTYDGLGADDPRWWPLWLASQIFLDKYWVMIEAGSLNGPVQQSVCRVYRPALVALIETPHALPQAERALCGRALARINDPRPGTGIVQSGPLAGVPDILWCSIPVGEFIFGCDEFYEQKPSRTAEITMPYKISRYPITNFQFKAFIDDPDGYSNAKWWDGLNAEGKVQQASGPKSPRFNFSNNPRDTVSWYESMAFCAWLSVRLGYKITLPSEEQWERAARGTKGLIYPYGNEFDTRKANVSCKGIGQTTAVGLYAEWASPDGVEEMSGNVAEWTLNQQKSGEIQDLSSDEERCTRGDTFISFNSERWTRGSARSGERPATRQGTVGALGFRVVTVAL